jgi:hypothetical protein
MSKTLTLTYDELYDIIQTHRVTTEEHMFPAEIVCLGHLCELDGVKAFPTSANKGKKVLKKPSKQ